MEQEQDKVTYKQWEELVQAIALKIGSSKYSLSDSDFALRLWNPKKLKGNAFVVKRAGIIRVYFAVSPSSPAFPMYIDEAMKAVSEMKHSKHSSIVKFALNAIRPQDVPSAYRELYGLPLLVSNNEIVIRHSYKVEIAHKGTGLVVSKEGSYKLNTFSKLTYDAKVELSELVNALREHQASVIKESEESPKGAEVVEGFAVFTECPKPFNYHNKDEELAEWAE